MFIEILLLIGIIALHVITALIIKGQLDTIQGLVNIILRKWDLKP